MPWLGTFYGAQHAAGNVIPLRLRTRGDVAWAELNLVFVMFACVEFFCLIGTYQRARFPAYIASATGVVAVRKM
jgi:hypothetical protein